MGEPAAGGIILEWIEDLLGKDDPSKTGEHA